MLTISKKGFAVINAKKDLFNLGIPQTSFHAKVMKHLGLREDGKKVYLLCSIFGLEVCP